MKQKLQAFYRDCVDSIFGNRPKTKVAYLAGWALFYYYVMGYTTDYYVFPIALLAPFPAFFWVFRD